MRHPARKAGKSTALGIVRTTEILSQRVLAIRLGVGERAVRAMFRAGLRFRKIRQTRYVSGREFRRFVEEQPCPDTTPPTLPTTST
jgi:hypothetical protein